MKCRRMLLLSSFILSGLMLVVLLTGCSSSQSNRPEEQTAAGPYDEILAAADARRDTFSGRTTETEAEGTVYYISNSGNDENDGLSPETAWATLGRAFETHWPLTRNFLQPGDAVLLERGGTWYVSPDDIDGLTSDAYNIVEGVTLGAYGEGARPVIRGDIPQANDPDFWTPYHSENGVQIWTCAEKLQDSNVLVLNGGKEWADEVMPHWSTVLNDYCNADGEPFDVISELKNDRTFCLLQDLDGYSERQDLSNPVHRGTLYFRCDEGNPAEVFDEISLPQAQTGLALHTDAALADLDLRYFTCLAAEMSSYDGHTGQQVRNCEVSWCGGLLHEYQPTDEGPDGVLRPYCAGGALQVSGSGNSVRDSYIHHCGPMTLICSVHVQGPGVYTYEDMTYSGNLLEYCGAPVHIADLAKMDDPGAEGFISNYTFTDNIVMNSGEGWVNGLILQIDGLNSIFSAAVENCMGGCNHDGISFTDNIFCGASSWLLCLTDNLWNLSGKVNQPMVFSGNVYAQPKDGGLCNFNWERGWGAGYAPDEQEFLDFIGDETGSVVPIP